MSCRLHNCNCCTAHGNRIVPLSKLCGKKCLGTDTLHLQELLVHANPSHDAPRSKRCADVIVRGGLEVFKLSTQFCMYLLSTAAYRLKKYHNFTHKSWHSCVDCSTQQHQNISDHFIKMLQKGPTVQTKQFVTHGGWRDEADSHLCLTRVCKKLHPQHPPHRGGKHVR